MNAVWKKQRRINKAELSSLEEGNEWAYVVNEHSLLYGLRTPEAQGKQTKTGQSREVRNEEGKIS